MKILHVTHHTVPCVGGIEKFVFELSKSLQKNGVDSGILCLDKCHSSPQNLRQKETIGEIEIFRIPFIDLKYYKIAPKVFSVASGFDVLHVHNIGFFSDFLALTKPFHKKKLVLNTHGGFFHTQKISFLKKIYFNTLFRLSMHFFDLVIADSRNDERVFGPILGKKLVLIGNGVNIDEFLKIGTKKRGNYFLFVGRLSKNKGLDALIRAFAVVVKNFPDARLCILGADFDGIKKELEELAKGLEVEKNVDILGGVSKKRLIEEMAKAQFCISASMYEGFGIAVIEQMACGQVPILSDIPNFRWFAGEGKAGVIVDFSDEQTAGKQIAGIMGKSEKELEELACMARERAKSFGWENCVPKIIQAYEKVLQK